MKKTFVYENTLLWFLPWSPWVSLQVALLVRP